jgi:hypothetical protein
MFKTISRRQKFRRSPREPAFPVGTAQETRQKSTGALPGHPTHQRGIEKVLPGLQAGKYNNNPNSFYRA